MSQSIDAGSQSIYGDTEFLPNLPGYRLKKNAPVTANGAKRVKMFRIIDGLVFPKDLSLPNIETNGGEFNGEKSIMVLGSGGMTSMISRPQSRALEMNRVNVVLTFFASFIQVSPNGSIDTANNKKSRTVNIYFYTEDGTMSIVERPELNSGLPQGTLCSRAVVWKSDGFPIDEDDFILGSSLEIFGQSYHIVDCDESTKRYFQRSAQNSPERGRNAGFDNSFDDGSMSIDQGRGMVGDADESQGGSELGSKVKGSWGEYRSRKNSNKTFLEAQLGNTVNNKGRDGFIRYGNKTLKFRCVWDNTSILYGDMVEFSLIYFLADDTVEIFSIPSNVNTSKDQCSRLLQRSKLPKKFGFKAVGSLTEDGENAYYHWSDLCIGLEMNVYARNIRVIDADLMTRSFYEHYNIPLTPKMDEQQASVAYHKREIPPSTGFGSEEDSLRSCQGPLQPGPPRVKKLGENKILTFLCSLISGGADALLRRFVLTFFVQDQTLKIEEKPVRNSGYSGGVFLSRRFIQQDNGENLCEKHLYVGAVVPVFKHVFRLLETDEVTLKWMEDKVLPQGTFVLICEKLRGVEALISDALSGQLASSFKAKEGRTGVVSKGMFSNVLRSYGLVHDEGGIISEHEIITIMRAIGDKKNQLDYNLFIEQLISNTSEL